MFRQSFVVNIWTRRPTGIAQMTGADAAVFDEGSRIVASLDGGMLFDDLPVPAPEAPQTSGAVFRKVPLPNVGSWYTEHRDMLELRLPLKSGNGIFALQPREHRAKQLLELGSQGFAAIWRQGVAFWDWHQPQLILVMPKSTPEPVELQHVPGFAADILVNHAEAIRSFVVRCDTFFENVLGDEPCANLAAIIVRVAAPADGGELKIRITGRLMLSRATPMDGVRLTKFIQDHVGE